MKYVFVALLAVSQAVRLPHKVTHPALGQLTGKNAQQDPEEIFDMLDGDGDGTLTFDEMIETYEEKIGPVPKAYIPEMRTEFNLVDEDGDGEVSRDDYLDYMESN